MALQTSRLLFIMIIIKCIIIGFFDCKFQAKSLKRLLIQKKKIKGLFMGLFQHCGRSAYCILTPKKFSHSSPESPLIIQMRENSTRKGGNYYQ